MAAGKQNDMRQIYPILDTANSNNTQLHKLSTYCNSGEQIKKN